MTNQPDQNRQFLTTLADLGIATHRLDRIRDAARLHRQQLLGTSELYAVIEADDGPEPAAAPAVVEPPSHRAGLRDRIAAAMREHYLSSDRDEADADRNMPCVCGDWREPGAEADDENDWDSHLADAVLAVLYREWPWLRAEAEDAKPADRSAVLREAADALDNSERLRDFTDDHMSDINEAANELRRMADETATVSSGEIVRQTATTETPAVDLPTLAAALNGLHTLIATSSRDWGTYRVDAWIWAVLCGWDCERPEHDDTCVHGALEEMQEQHGWDDATVAKARRYRAAVRAITEPEPAAGARQDETATETPAPDSATLLELVRDFLDPDPCSFDHHGYCQAHAAGFGGEPMSCPHGRARKLLADLEQPAAGARQDETATETPADRFVHPCNAATMHRLGNLATAHGPHLWVMQPDMESVRCPGTRQPAAGVRQDGATS